MKKRIAYIGLSYPLLYDYANQASPSQNDISDSPNPIIESPMGLMILYDELWFLCESLCPNNMRKLCYVKFVDKEFPDLYYEGAEDFITDINLKIESDRGLSYAEILKRMNLQQRNGLDVHTHLLRIGNYETSARSGEDKLAFDLYILEALQEISDCEIELIANSRFCLRDFEPSNKAPRLVEKIVIPNIPNYLQVDGPYDPCMEVLRNHEYITDFRKWVTDNHNTIQRSEIDDMCESVQRTIEETQKKVFNKYLKDNDKYAFFASSGKTMLKTNIGLLSGGFSVVDALLGITVQGKKTLEANKHRWQGFVVNSRDIAEASKISL
ncbi:MAG: hypothetical protein E7291_05515 [Lachnospiraceae bacterium]|nr:hypothetical protein [Lachnospiraceae bacterium]